jgi:hypothetical protein
MVDLSPIYFPVLGLIFGLLVGDFWKLSTVYFIFAILTNTWLYSFAVTLPDTTSPNNVWMVHYPTLFAIFGAFGVYLVKVVLRATKSRPSPAPLEYMHSTHTFVTAICFYVLAMVAQYFYGMFGLPINFLVMGAIVSVLWWVYYFVSSRWVKQVETHRFSINLVDAMESPAVWHTQQECLNFFLYSYYLMLALFLLQFIQYAPGITPTELTTQFIAAGVIVVVLAAFWINSELNGNFLPPIKTEGSAPFQGTVISQVEDEAEGEVEDTQLAGGDSDSSGEEEAEEDAGDETDDTGRAGKHC